MRTGTTNLDFVHAGGQVYLDEGAVIDVAGSTAVSSTLSQYIVSIVLRGSELADAALQRNSNLRGATITVTLGGTSGGRWMVESGLKNGDRVVVEGGQKLHPDDRVQASLVEAMQGQDLIEEIHR